VVGLKTTFGRIPTTGVAALGPTLDTVGPMAADVTNTAVGMQMLEPGFTWRDTPPAGRVGRFRLPAAPWVDVALDEALAASGLETVDVVIPGWDAASEAFGVILGTEVWQVHRDLWEKDGDRLSPDVSARIAGGAAIDAFTLATAQEASALWATELNDVLSRVDVVALPVLADEPPTIEDATRMGELRYTGPFNVAGVPALALPVPGPGRFPASLQLVGRPGTEAMLLSTGAVIEAAVAR
jgi:Asp-tRNA(Asn)/Glu-tRNA(Gln) amidotransferase A subunit family amidase